MPKLNRPEKAAAALNLLFEKKSSPKGIQKDPVEFLHDYTDPKDIEIAGLISAALAYGRVDLFKKITRQILEMAEGHLFDYLSNFSPKQERSRFKGLYYRFSTEEDLFAFIHLISRTIKTYGSIGDCFLSHYQETDEDIGPALTAFVQSLTASLDAPVSPGLRYLLPSPNTGSACKRFNLFLRWMIRPKDGIDFGLWKTIPPAKLIMPLDTHIIRIAQYLRLTTRKSPDWKMAKEITVFLKRCDPEDPLKYDFALCHLGISGACPIELNEEKCQVCLIQNICFREKKCKPRDPSEVAQKG